MLLFQIFPYEVLCQKNFENLIGVDKDALEVSDSSETIVHLLTSKCNLCISMTSAIALICVNVCFCFYAKFISG